eukprot:20536-Heterococcus_DN1.PRE.3
MTENTTTCDENWASHSEYLFNYEKAQFGLMQPDLTVQNASCSSRRSVYALYTSRAVMKTLADRFNSNTDN